MWNKFILILSVLFLSACNEKKEVAKPVSTEQPQSVLEAKKIIDDTKKKLDASMQLERDRLKEADSEAK